MLLHAHKLSSVEFSRVFNTGSKKHTDNLMITYLRNQSVFKSAVVVSKKQTKTAILRNYKRRVIFNSINNIYKEYAKDLAGIHMIVMLKKGSLGVSQNQITQEIQHFIKKI